MRHVGTKEAVFMVARRATVLWRGTSCRAKPAVRSLGILSYVAFDVPSHMSVKYRQQHEGLPPTGPERLIPLSVIDQSSQWTDTSRGREIDLPVLPASPRLSI